MEKPEEVVGVEEQQEPEVDSDVEVEEDVEKDEDVEQAMSAWVGTEYMTVASRFPLATCATRVDICSSYLRDSRVREDFSPLRYSSDTCNSATVSTRVSGRSNTVNISIAPRPHHHQASTSLETSCHTRMSRLCGGSDSQRENAEVSR